MVGRMIEQHTEKGDKDKAYASTLFAVRGIGPHLVDSRGQAWTAAYVNEGGNVVRDLRADIAAEAGARQTYEALIKLAPDKGSKQALTFLLTLAVWVRRLHDGGYSGHLLWLSLIGLSIIPLIFAILEGNNGPNKYGPDPKAVEGGVWPHLQQTSPNYAQPPAAYGQPPAAPAPPAYQPPPLDPGPDMIPPTTASGNTDDPFAAPPR